MSESHQREAAIFDAAMELPPGQRAAHLDHACGGDAALRQRIESLLKAGESQCEFLDPPDDPKLLPTLQITVPLSEKVGDRIGRYKLLQQIGEGGCGVVYMAEQEEPVSRRVALKVIKLGLDTKSVIARFEAERQALALMDHPNIARVLDAGATETGRPYFVMELVRGLKITEYCDEARLSTNARLDLFIQVCQAIQHAHQKGIIHRDIKPSNILVTINDGVPVPKVIDFGIAKATGGLKLTNKTLFTAFEQFIGTPAYMSPEQAVLTSLDIDTRSDIYALGVLLYELLTGRTPFDAKELLAIGLDEMRRTIREQEPQRPSTRLSTLAQNELSTTAQRRGIEAPKLVSELRGDLDWIVMKALEKDRARRYETANGLAMDIQRHQKNEPVVACPPSRLYRFQKTVRRNKLAFTAAGAVVAALVIGLGIATWMFVKERAAVREQSRLRQEAQTEAARSAQVTQVLKDMLKGVGPSVALGQDTKMLQKILADTVKRFDTELTNHPAVRAELEEVVGLTYWDLGEFTKSEAMYRDALDIWRKVYGKEHRKIADSLYGLGVALESQEKVAESEDVYRQALAMRRKVLGNESEEVGDSLRRLAAILYNHGKRAEVEGLLREALAIRKKLYGNEHPKVADVQSFLAELSYAEGKIEAAEYESVLRNCLVTYRKLLGPENFSVVGVLDGLGGLCAGGGRLEEAESLYRESLAMRKKLEGNEHPGVAFSLNNLAGVLAGTGRLAEAEQLCREALAINRERLGESHPRTTGVLINLALILARQGKQAEYASLIPELAERGDAPTLNQLAWQLATSADPKLRDGPTAVRLAEKAVAKTNRKDPMILDTLAAAYAEVGQFARAVTAQQEAIALLQDEKQKEDYASRLQLYQSNSPYRDEAQVAATLAERTMLLLGEQKFTEAEPLARECLAIREKKSPDDWRTFNSRSMVGGSLLGQKKYAEAEPLLLSGYEGMMQREDKIPPLGRPRLKETLQRLVQLYEATGRAVQATEWKQKLAKFDEPTTPKTETQAETK